MEDNQLRQRTMVVNLANNSENKRFDSDYYVEGYATTFDPYVLYRDGNGEPIYEQIDPHAFEGAIMNNVIFQYDHEGRVFARQKNRTLGLEVTPSGLFIYADLGKTEKAKSLYEDIKAGMIDQMSWRFTVAPDGEEYDPATRTIHIRKVREVFDVSAVSIPANNQTSICARSRQIVDDYEKKQKLSLERQNKIKKIQILSNL